MNDEDLDKQIRAALDVEPSAEQIARLEHFWTQRSQAEDWRRRLWRVAALAACILAFASVSVWQFRSRSLSQAEKTGGVAPTAPIASQEVRSHHPEAALPIEMLHDEEPAAVGRAPTAYERLVFSIGRREPAAARTPELATTVDKLIDELVRDPDADAQRLMASADLAADDVERLLLRRMERSADVKKRAVLRLLAVCGSSRSKLALLRLGRRESFRDAAVMTIEQIVGVERISDLVGEASNTRVQSALIRRLLMADSEAGLRGYLSLVENNDTRALALAVAKDLPNPPAGALLACLDDEEEAVRLSAAIVLGHLNGPHVTKLLVDRVTQKPEGGVEAWIALLACQGKLAEEFLAFATRQPQLLAHVNSARVRWARIIN